MTYNRHDPQIQRENVREHLEYLWLKATQLDNVESPLTYAIIQECMEMSEPHYIHEDMAQTMRTLADDCFKFAEVLDEEAEA